MNISDEQLRKFLEKTDRDAFADAINTTFRVDDVVDVELIEVSERKSYPRQDSFSMLFRFPVDFPPFQGNHKFEHPQLLTNEIFVVPIEQTPDGIVFEAVFNRILPKDQA